MTSKYNMDNDEPFFEIGEDSTIYPKPPINGNEHSIQTKSNDGYVLVIILLIITSIILSIMYVESDNDKQYYESELYNVRSQISSIENGRDEAIAKIQKETSNMENELSKLKSKVSNTYPIIITNIEFGNQDDNGVIETDYGNTIYSSCSMYIVSKIHYTGMASGSKTINVKWFNPDGSLRSGASSPSGYSFTSTISIYSGNNSCTLSGWGNKNKGHWDKGVYRIEVWYEDVCLKSKNLSIR